MENLEDKIGKWNLEPREIILDIGITSAAATIAGSLCTYLLYDKFPIPATAMGLITGYGAWNTIRAAYHYATFDEIEGPN